MKTITATATARNPSTLAIAAAVREAASGLNGAKPTYGFIFAGPAVDLQPALIAAREAAGGALLVGCTTAGEVSARGLSHDSAVVMLVASDATTQLAYATGLKRNPREVGAKLLLGMAETRKAATAQGHRYLTSVLLTDGLTGTAERLVEAMYDARVQSASQIVGGAAGDEAAFTSTFVGGGDSAGSDAAVALHVFSARGWGIGVDHGLQSTTRQMRVTKAHENVVMEINNEPAFMTYQRHAAERGITLTHESAPRYMVENELGIHFFEKMTHARAPLRVNADGSLVCAAEVPRGSMVSIAAGEPSKLIDAARTAASKAHAALGGAPAAGVLLFDCVCRGMMLGSQFSREIEAVRSVFGDVPIAGFLTYGEIARFQGHLHGWHNATVVCVAIPA